MDRQKMVSYGSYQHKTDVEKTLCVSLGTTIDDEGSFVGS